MNRYPKKKMGNTYSKRSHNNSWKSKDKFQKREQKTNFQMENQLEETFDLEKMAEADIFDLKNGAKDFTRQGFLANFRETLVRDQDEETVSALVLTILNSTGEWFTCFVKQEPYFFLKVTSGYEGEVMSFLEKEFDGKISSSKIEEKVDLDQLNHLSGIKNKYIRLNFKTSRQFQAIRKEMGYIVRQNRLKTRKKTVLGAKSGQNLGIMKQQGNVYGAVDSGMSSRLFEMIEDIREHDVQYVSRVAIDRNLRVGKWYNILARNGFVSQIECEESLLEIPELGVLAFDIETTKQPLKFPDAKIDEVMLISYVVDGEACLVVNRHIISTDILPFNYAPHPDIEYDVTIFNEADEKETILRFYKETRNARPMVITTFNGDNFDWPFLRDRGLLLDIDLEKELGFLGFENERRAILKHTFKGQLVFTHLDCYHWVRRDAYLPQGSHGLKAVTKAKLGYDPIEVDPEMMVPLASSNPQKLCEYSVSDAVATYHLYKKHIHDFILALCSIVPLEPEMVLRHGSGVLCEKLLMAQANSNNIVFPSKKGKGKVKYYKNHPIESETYVGGYVECINEGVYRSDIPTNFKLNNLGYNELLSTAKTVLDFFIENENNTSIEEVENYQEVLSDINSRLFNLQEQCQSNPGREVDMLPLIYHVDVAAMYPNIILTNRLQPTAIVDNKTCCNCIYNRKENKCKRRLGWEHKVRYHPISRKEYELIASKHTGFSKKDELLKAVKQYSMKNYKKMHESKIDYKEDTICMRENSFYVDTIRDFRDRRYRFKALTKVHKRAAGEASKSGNFEKAKEHTHLATLYDSLQLAHKIILNSFYGYVMKRNARWYSMEMAAMVTYTGAKIIQSARDMLEKVGKVLELDTDGVWTLLPAGFPEKYTLRTKSGKQLHLGYPCSLMNHLIYDKFKNTQYQDLSKNGQYSKRTEMSIYFELDGPYRAMVIPASREEGKKLKKRYCVFDFDGKISELKGFELKRRGELEIIKKFQKEIFCCFLEGTDLKTCYDACAETAKRWMDIILKKGASMDQSALFELLAESKVLSKNLEEYGDQKGVALTAAKRLAQFLGDNNVFRSAGLRLNFIISKQPEDKPVSQRAVPLQVFKLPPETRNRFLTKWLGFPTKSNFSIVKIIDWDYYFERFSKNIQKLITIPAVLQGLKNPIEEVINPKWLVKRIRERGEKEKQTSLTSFFKKAPETLKEVEQAVKERQRALEAQPIVEEEKENQNTGRAQDKIKEEDDLATQNNTNALSQDEITQITQKMKRISIVEPENPQKFGKFNMKLLKSKWKSKFKKARERQKEGRGMNTHHSISNIDKILERKVKNCNWQVLQTVDLGNGKLLQHVIVQREFMQQVEIQKQRRIFINFFRDQKNNKWKLCKKKLPRDKTAWHLYQLDFEETIFQKEFAGFDLFLTNPEVEGVYETQIDLDFGLIRDIGVTCSVYKDARDRLVYDKTVGEFRLPAEALRNYLRPGQGDSESLRVLGNCPLRARGLQHCLLWGVQANSKAGAFVWGARHAVFLMCGNSTNKIKKQALVDFKNFVQNLVQSEVEHLSQDDQDFDWSSYRVEVKYSSDQKQFVKDVHSALELFIPLAQTHSPSPSFLTSCTNLSFQSMVSPETLRKLFKVPMLDLTYSEPITLDSLTWRKTLAKKGARYLPELNHLLQMLDRLASFSQIPLANLGGTLAHSLVTSMDTLFARRLESMNYLSWYSQQKLPDLGQRGLVQPESAFLLEMSDEEDEVMDQKLNSRKVIRPGTYDGYVVELTLEMFVMNSLINANSFEENEILEKELLKNRHIQKFLNPSLRFGGTEIQNNAAFKIIKELLVSWYKKIRLEEDPSADLLITNIMSWMTSPESKFFDPAVRRRFLRVVRKAFDSLLVKLEDLGAGIVMADYHKILIQTNRNDWETASSFRDYVIANIKEDSRFEYIGLEPGKTYAMLILYDEYNYLGVVIDENPDTQGAAEPIAIEAHPVDQLPTGANDIQFNSGTHNTDTQPISMNQTPTPISYGMDSTLNMHSALPPEMQTILLSLLEHFLNESFNLLLTTRNQNAEKTLKNVKSEFELVLEQYVKNNFSQNLFESIDYMKEQLKLHHNQQIEKTKNPNLSKNDILEEVNSSFDEPRELSDYENDSFVEKPEEEFADLLEEEQRNDRVDLLAQDKDDSDQENIPPTSRNVAQDPWECCEIVGQTRKLQNPILEFINLIFEVLTAGDLARRQCLSVLKENVMLYLQQDAYGEASKFQPIIGPFALHDVKCLKCRNVSSIDIFRDFLAGKQAQAEQGVFTIVPYPCQCGETFDKEVLESKIIDKLEQKIKSCLGHDLYCIKCLGIRCSLFLDRCVCSGKYVFREGHFAKQFKKQLVSGLGSFKRLAQALNMQRLRRFIESLVY